MLRRTPPLVINHRPSASRSFSFPFSLPLFQQSFRPHIGHICPANSLCLCREGTQAALTVFLCTCVTRRSVKSQFICKQTLQTGSNRILFHGSSVFHFSIMHTPFRLLSAGRLLLRREWGHRRPVSHRPNKLQK